MQPAANRSMQLSWCLLQKGEYWWYTTQVDLDYNVHTCRIHEAIFPAYEKWKKLFVWVCNADLLPSKASTRVRTRDTQSRQGDALVRTLHVLVSNSLPQKWRVQEKSFRILRLKATCGGDAASSWRMLQNVSKFKSLPFSETSIQPTVLHSTKMENCTNKLQHTHGHSSKINYLQVSRQLLTAAVGVHPTIWPMSVWRLTVARKLQMGAFQAG